MAETVPSKRSTFSISSSMIWYCFWIKSLDLLVWWLCCCWDVGGAGVPLMLVALAFLAYFFVSFSSFIHNKDFITNYVNICEISLYMILSFVFATNHLVKTWPHATIMKCQMKVHTKNQWFYGHKYLFPMVLGLIDIFHGWVWENNSQLFQVLALSLTYENWKLLI